MEEEKEGAIVPAVDSSAACASSILDRRTSSAFGDHQVLIFLLCLLKGFENLRQHKGHEKNSGERKVPAHQRQVNPKDKKDRNQRLLQCLKGFLAEYLLRKALLRLFVLSCNMA